MARLAIVLTVVGCLLLSLQPVQGQSANKEFELVKKELDLSKKECELARKENDALKKENEQLKKEIEQLKKATDKKGGDKADKPSASADGINYVLDKVSRNGTRVTLHIIAINTKADCLILPGQVEAVDNDGNLYTSSLLRPMAARLRLREGVKTRFDVAIPNVPSSATEFSRVEIHGVTRLGSLGQRMIGSGTETVQFKNVRFGK